MSSLKTWRIRSISAALAAGLTLTISAPVLADDSDAGELIAFAPVASASPSSATEPEAAAHNVISPDQPGYAFSSQTVGAGRFEIETSLERDVNGGDYRAWSAPTLLRYGVTDNLEARVASSTYMVYDGELGAHASGWNDLNVGVKYHLPSSGQDGAPSLGFLFNAALDTGSPAFRGFGVRPSLSMSAEWTLPGNYALAVSPGVVYDNQGNGRYLGGLAAVAIGRDVGDTGHVTVELAAPRIAPRSDGGNQYSFDVGYTLRIADDTQLDVGANFGLNKQTPDVELTFGFSHRF